MHEDVKMPKMELKYIVMTIIKILISVPAILLITRGVEGAALMGGHLDNTSNSTITSNLTNPYETSSFDEEFAPPTNASQEDYPEGATTGNEEIPDPSALVVPGYNLPENIFNKGKPFYLEKDPLTGKVDFDSSSLLNVEQDEYGDYVDDVSGDIYDKANIDRKDGSLASHKASDVNQLTPNFHDFLNLPVKYNPDKYVYPLISSSYANTKVQGNLNKYQNLNNHKNYVVTTYKPTFSPNYHTVKTPYFDPVTRTAPTIVITTTTTTRPTTTRPPTTTTTTTKAPNLMNNAMGHPSFDDYTTQTTGNVNDIYLTTNKYPSTTTRRPLSLFEQLFGDYDEITTTEHPLKKPPPLFQNLPGNKNSQSRPGAVQEEATEAPGELQPSRPEEPHNVLTGTNMGVNNPYEYDDEYEEVPSESDNKVYQTKTVKYEMKTTVAVTSPSTASPTSTTRTTTSIPRTTTSTTTTTKSTIPDDYDFEPSLPDSNEYDLKVEDNGSFNNQPTTELVTSTKVTSLPLGENHFGTPDLRPPPIIAVTHHLKERLNSEKVQPKPFIHHPVASTSNVRIPPDQDSVSFVVGDHQNVGGGFVGSSFKEGPYDNSPFRPLIIQADNDKDTVSYSVQAKPEFNVKPSFSQNFPDLYQGAPPKQAEVGGSSVNIQPIKTSEASLSIGVPLNSIKKVPGLVVDGDLENEKIEFPKKGTGAKIVFPDEKGEKASTFTPDFAIAPPKQPNREVLQLSSKPMYHQLPSDLTPPSEQDLPPPPPTLMDRPRPPWDPRPGHFYNGRPEYMRPPRPQQKPKPGEMYKRIDNLPNILPQFRPNANHYYDHMTSMKNGYMRQPLLERPSNRPVGFFEKLLPPPPPKNLHNLRKVPMLEQELRLRQGEEYKKHETYEFYQHPTPPPQPILANRRKTEEPPAIETLQMIQAKQVEKQDQPPPVKSVSTSAFKTNLKGKDSTEKPLYVVYPVNSAPIKLDALDSGKKETVVVGTRAELPLPPSKINQEFNYESPKDRNDSPILKPHPKPSNFPIKSNFPYPLERPDVIGPLAPTYPDSLNNLDLKEERFPSNNQWGAVQSVLDTEPRIVTGSKINYKNPNQISVTLKTYTEKPIAVAYTPTEPYKRLENTEKYSMPNYASPVISEIRPGFMDKAGSEITVSAVMHTHAQADLAPAYEQKYEQKYVDAFDKKYVETFDKKYLENHKMGESEETPTKLDFQAPFQASVNVDGMTQGWSVVRNSEKSKVDRSDQDVETTTLPIATTREFDIENFKPQLFGGFKPIYSFPEEGGAKEEGEFAEREERTV